MSFKIKAVKPTLDEPLLDGSHLDQLNEIANELNEIADKMDDDNKELAATLDEYALKMKAYIQYDETEQLRKLYNG